MIVLSLRRKVGGLESIPAAASYASVNIQIDESFAHSDTATFTKDPNHDNPPWRSCLLIYRVASNITNIPNVLQKLDNEVEWVPDGPDNEVCPTARQGEVRGNEFPRLVIPTTTHTFPRVAQFTDTVQKIRHALETKFKCKLNHDVLTRYENGKDWYKDIVQQTLDLASNSTVIVYSAGDCREITFKSKENGDVTDLTLFNDKAMAVDSITNEYFTHTAWDRNYEGTGGNGYRIGISFCLVDTMSSHNRHGVVMQVWGGGAGPRPVDGGMSEQELKDAYDRELTTTDYTWQGLYRKG